MFLYVLGYILKILLSNSYKNKLEEEMVVNVISGALHQTTDFVRKLIALRYDTLANNIKSEDYFVKLKLPPPPKPLRSSRTSVNIIVSKFESLSTGSDNRNSIDTPFDE